MVSVTAAAGTPAEPGTPPGLWAGSRWATAEPDSARSASPWPW